MPLAQHAGGVALGCFAAMLLMRWVAPELSLQKVWRRRNSSLGLAIANGHSWGR